MQSNPCLLGAAIKPYERTIAQICLGNDAGLNEDVVGRRVLSTSGTANDMRLMSLQSQGSNRTNNHRMRGSLLRKSNWSYCRGKRDDMMDWKALLLSDMIYLSSNTHSLPGVEELVSLVGLVDFYLKKIWCHTTST